MRRARVRIMVGKLSRHVREPAGQSADQVKGIVMSQTQLVEIRGIGPSAATILKKGGFPSVAAVAAAKLAEVVMLNGFGPTRAAQVIAAAKALVKSAVISTPGAGTPTKKQSGSGKPKSKKPKIKNSGAKGAAAKKDAKKAKKPKRDKRDKRDKAAKAGKKFKSAKAAKSKKVAAKKPEKAAEKSKKKKLKKSAKKSKK